MMPAERIERPERLRLPADLATLQDVFSELTEVGAKRFAAELLDALEKGRVKGDLAPVAEVVEVWFRTLAFVRRQGFEEAVREAEELEGAEGLRLDELLKEYDLPEPDPDATSKVRIMPLRGS